MISYNVTYNSFSPTIHIYYDSLDIPISIYDYNAWIVTDREVKITHFNFNAQMLVNIQTFNTRLHITTNDSTEHVIYEKVLSEEEHNTIIKEFSEITRVIFRFLWIRFIVNTVVFIGVFILLDVGIVRYFVLCALLSYML
jgi:hypothetical protein